MKIKLLILAIIVLAILIISCIRNLPKYIPPKDHTISNQARLHKPGLYYPYNNCSSCHGTNLTGDTGPSCYRCHGQKWY